MQPRHVAFIMDGNRRFSKRLMEKPWKGHEWGAKKLREVLSWCEEEGIEEVTLYALSLQNLDRPKVEFDYLMRLGNKVASKVIDDPSELIDKGVRIRFIGRTHLLPDDLQVRMARIEELTASGDNHRLNIAVAYGGREEIVDAIAAIAAKVSSGDLSVDAIDEHEVSSHLYLDSEPDLIIRTGGDHRTSNFLVWQSWYSEWCFVDSLWPELSRDDFQDCIDRFKSTERRFGR